MSLHNLQLVVPEAYIGELNCLSNGLQMTTIKSIEPNRLISQKLTDLSNYLLCHGRLGHPGQKYDAPYPQYITRASPY